MKESDLATHFVSYFEEKGYEIYKEVPFDGIIDIVAVMGSFVTSIEVKLSLNLEVIRQGFRNRNCAHISYVAVPKTKNMEMAKKICATYGIGVLLWEYNMVKEIVKPKINRRICRPKLQEYMKRSVAGSVNDRITPFKLTIEEIVKRLNREGGSVNAKEFFGRDYYHYGSSGSALQCIRKLTNQGLIKELKFEKGFLKLADS